MSVVLGLLANRVLLAAVLAWTIAQIIKVPLNYLLHREWDWSLLFAAGGMPSSHTALVTGIAIGVGLQDGFQSTTFAVAAVLAAVVIYDATGVRRHAGDHARVLNLMIDELLTGHPLAEKELKEVLGHTPREVIGGLLLGMVTAYVLLRVV
ncbi:MAG: divergent PAP2 family protein [Anaerolineales bacterium]|nr:divergent PAP2 family protein [Anaerolineales bacterium]